MENNEKLWQQIDRELEQLKCVMNKEYCYQAIILNLVKICRTQEEQIDTLIEYVNELQGYTGNDNARINALEREIEAMKRDIKWVTDNTSL